MNREQIIQEFHRMWDAFPGMARLISGKHEILASNGIAQKKGFKPGCICAQVGDPQTHRGCLLARCIRTGEGCFDRPREDLIRGWLPVRGAEDCVVHFSIVPSQAEQFFINTKYTGYH